MSEAIHRGEAIADLAGPPVVQRVHVALRKGRIAEDFNAHAAQRCGTPNAG